MKNLSGNASYENLHPNPTKKKQVAVEETVTVLLSREELKKLVDDYKSLQERCEKLYSERSLKELSDINITLHMLDKHFKLLDQHAE